MKIIDENTSNGLFKSILNEPNWAAHPEQLTDMMKSIIAHYNEVVEAVSRRMDEAYNDGYIKGCEDSERNR